MKPVLMGILSVCALIAPAPAAAAVNLTIEDTDGDPGAITGVQPGDTFTILVKVDSDDGLVALEFKLGADTAGVFDLTALSFGEEWYQPGELFGLPFDPPVGLDPVTEDRLGAGLRDTGSPLSGAFTFATIDVEVDEAAADGTYTLSFSDTAATLADLTVVDATAADPAYSITVAADGGDGHGGLCGFGVLPCLLGTMVGLSGLRLSSRPRRRR